MIALTAPLPLRLSSVWSGYREAKPIPHRYGDTAGAPLQFNPQRTQFVWADHAVAGIDDLLIDGQPAGGWTWQNTTDETGHAIARIDLTQPADEGAQLLARGRGKLHSATGATMTNPADVVWDVLANIAGRDVTTGMLAEFRRECERAGLTVGGSIEAADSVQAIVRAICAAVGAVFCGPATFRLWPGGDVPASRASITQGEVECTARLDGLCNDLTIQYAHADGQARASLRLEAPDSVSAYGRRADTLEARWLASARVAAAVGTRLLQHRARPVWALRVRPARAVAVGDALTLAQPSLPASGRHLVLGITRSLDDGTVDADVAVAMGDLPAVRLVSQSTAFDPTQYAGVSATTQGDQRILTLKEDDGRPIVNAAVTLDGRITHYTDAAGRVSFSADSMPPGEHTLVIVTTDGRTLTTTVLIA